MRVLGSVQEIDGSYSRIWIEPHFDDVPLSAGGMVAASSDRGERNLVLTLFAAAPGADAHVTAFAAGQHTRWGHVDDPIGARRAEQVAALDLLGADWLPFDWHDAIYRGEQYLSDDDLFGQVKLGDAALRREIAALMADIAARAPRARWYAPLAVGNHVDHQIALDAAPRSVELWGYEDFPYAAIGAKLDRRVGALGLDHFDVVDITKTIERRIDAIRCYTSQIPTLFRTEAAMVDAVWAFAGARGAGSPAECFWRLRPA